MTAFLLFLAAHAVLVMRPSELIPGADGVQFYLPLIAAAVLASTPRLLYLVRQNSLINQPVPTAVIGLVAAVGISHASNGDLSLAVTSSLMMLKTAVYVLVLITVITTPRRLRTFLAVTAISGAVMIASSVVSYRQFVADWSGRDDLLEVYREDRMRPLQDKVLTHVVEFEEIDDVNLRQPFFRMRGYGIFGDPNDLSTLILFSLIVSLFFLRSREIGKIRYLWLINIALLLYAQSCTQSRGGLVSAAVALSVFCLMKYGKRAVIILGLLFLAASPVVAGRMASFSLEDGTGQERIQLWSDGLLQLQTGRAIFGIGEGRYADISGMRLKAHNSWIHAFTELGLFGGLLFFSCAFFPALGFWRLKRAGIVPEDPILRRLLPFIPAMLAGLCFALCALSRCYTPATYMVFGTAAAYLNIVGYRLNPPRPIVRLSNWTISLCVAYGLALLLATFVFVKIFVRF